MGGVDIVDGIEGDDGHRVGDDVVICSVGWEEDGDGDDCAVCPKTHFLPYRHLLPNRQGRRGAVALCTNLHFMELRLHFPIRNCGQANPPS